MFHADCICGHMWAEHEHYRAGSDCASCICDRYRSRRWWRRAPLPADLSEFFAAVEQYLRRQP